MNESMSPADLQAFKKEILSSLHCALPGIVESFDEETGTDRELVPVPAGVGIV